MEVRYHNKTAYYQSSTAPGTKYIIWSLYLTYGITLRLLLIQWHIPISTRFISQFGNLLVLVLMMIAFYRFSTSGAARYLSYPRLRIWAIIWIAMVSIQLCLGIIWGNFWLNSGREAIALLYYPIFLYFGLDDRVWHSLQKHLTILVFVTLPFIFIYYKTPAPNVSIDEMASAFKQVSSQRYTGSLGYEFRILIKPAIFLTMWGLISSKGGVLRIFQILAVPCYFAIEVGLFKFRSQAVICVGVFASFMVLRPFLEHRLRPKMTAIILILLFSGTAYYLTTDSFELLYQRAFVATQKSRILDSRDDELKALLSNLGSIDMAIGRGMGGAFDASRVYHFKGSEKWRTVHYGILVFLLKGGAGLLFMFIFLLQNSIRIRPKPWYLNPCNLTASLLIPLYLLTVLFLPFDLRPEAQMAAAPIMLALSRYFRRIEFDTRWIAR